MIKLLGSLDILTGISLILLNYGLFNWIVIVLLIYLPIKSFIFFGGFLSVVDLIIVAIAIISIFNINFLLIPSGIYLIAKGFYSLV